MVLNRYDFLGFGVNFNSWCLWHFLHILKKDMAGKFENGFADWWLSISEGLLSLGHKILGLIRDRIS